jgi:3-hydroxybutyryl-CoA dehydrogenase
MCSTRSRPSSSISGYIFVVRCNLPLGAGSNGSIFWPAASGRDLIPSEITVAIIGAGPLGRSLALRAARVGFRVALEDVMPASLRHAEEALREALGPEAMPLVAFARTVEEAVRHADLAIDCVPDELESKLEIFSLLDRMAPPRTVFATPSTNLSIADLASCTYRPSQCVGLAVDAARLSSEFVGSTIPIRVTSRTTAETQALVCNFWQLLGYTPLVTLDETETMLR